MSNAEKEQEYLSYLPAIFQMDSQEGTAGFLERFLQPFKIFLSGNGDATTPAVEGFEKILDQIHNYFDAERTPAMFLPWLASWLALTLKEDKEWYGDSDFIEKKASPDQVLPLTSRGITKNRNLINQIVRLYRKRGTLDGILEYLKVYVGEDVQIAINEYLNPFQVGVTSTVGENSVIGDGRPYYFYIYMLLPVPDRNLLVKKRFALHEIIDKEKPAHTYYGLTIEVPTMQVGVYSTVGVDTMLGGLIS